MPRYRAVYLGIGAWVAAGTVIWAGYYSGTKYPHTFSKEWIAAGKEYRKFQNQDPIKGNN